MRCQRTCVLPLALQLTNNCCSCADDNVYFDASYRTGTVGGPGYVADTDLCDDGELHPGVSLWGIRDMVKRSATLQHVLGKQYTSLMFHVSDTALPNVQHPAVSLITKRRSIR